MDKCLESVPRRSTSNTHSSLEVRRMCTVMCEDRGLGGRETSNCAGGQCVSRRALCSVNVGGGSVVKVD